MGPIDNDSENEDELTVSDHVLREFDKSRRNTYTIRVPLVLQRKDLFSGNEQTTTASDNADKPLSDK